MHPFKILSSVLVVFLNHVSRQINLKTTKQNKKLKTFALSSRGRAQDENGLHKAASRENQVPDMAVVFFPFGRK